MKLRWGCRGGFDGREGRYVFANAFDGLQHEFCTVLDEDDEADAVAFGDFDGFFETHPVNPEREGVFDGFLEE